MPIEHFGLGVPDVDAAQAYYDELMPMVGYQRCFNTGYCPEDWQGAQLFLYPTLEDGTCLTASCWRSSATRPRKRPPHRSRGGS